MPACSDRMRSPRRRRHGATYRVNPLYVITPDGDRLRLRLQFPSADYEDEYGACRQYLPEETSVARDALARLEAGGPLDDLADLVRRRVIVDLPRRLLLSRGPGAGTAELCYVLLRSHYRE